MRAALLALLALAPMAAAQPPDSAAQCAAFWLGRDDYARASAYLDRDPGDTARAAKYRAAALRLNGGKAAPVDALIAEQRPLMELLMDAAIYGGDRQSRALHDRLLQTCEDIAAEAPEFAAP